MGGPVTTGTAHAPDRRGSMGIGTCSWGCLCVHSIQMRVRSSRGRLGLSEAGAGSFDLPVRRIGTDVAPDPLERAFGFVDQTAEVG